MNNKNSQELKFDEGKLDWTLVNFEELKETVKVLMFGAKKYSRESWKKVEKERYEKAMMRHMISHISGDKIDDESGLSHLAHIIVNCLFIQYFDNKK